MNTNSDRSLEFATAGVEEEEAAFPAPDTTMTMDMDILAIYLTMEKLVYRSSLRSFTIPISALPKAASPTSRAAPWLMTLLSCDAHSCPYRNYQAYPVFSENDPAQNPLIRPREYIILPLAYPPSAVTVGAYPRIIYKYRE